MEENLLSPAGRQLKFVAAFSHNKLSRENKVVHGIENALVRKHRISKSVFRHSSTGYQ